MEINGTTANTGVQAIQAANERIEESAQEISQINVTSDETQAPDENVNIVESLVELDQAELQAQAAAEVIEAENNVLGTLLDTEA